jgi:DNA-directed RNA polymerase sigma subunit (sigma70/sigma32)
MNTRNIQRDEYIFAERQKGRTYRDIGQELGISFVRVRQVYVYVCRERRQEYFKTHPEEYMQWRENPKDKKWNQAPYV